MKYLITICCTPDGATVVNGESLVQHFIKYSGLRIYNNFIMDYDTYKKVRGNIARYTKVVVYAPRSKDYVTARDKVYARLHGGIKFIDRLDIDRITQFLDEPFKDPEIFVLGTGDFINKFMAKDKPLAISGVKVVTIVANGEKVQFIDLTNLLSDYKPVIHHNYDDFSLVEYRHRTPLKLENLISYSFEHLMSLEEAGRTLAVRVGDNGLEIVEVT